MFQGLNEIIASLKRETSKMFFFFQSVTSLGSKSYFIKITYTALKLYPPYVGVFSTKDGSHDFLTRFSSQH